MADLLRLAVVLDLLGVWMYGSEFLYKLLCHRILRRDPTGGAAAALALLVYCGTYGLVLDLLWSLWAP
jgi:hypothetical protein